MKLGISTASFFTKVLTENCFSALRDMNVHTTEVFLSSSSEYEKGFVDALASRLNGDMTVHSVHALSNQFEGELFSQSRRVRDDAEAVFRKICYAGNALGAKYYTFHGPLSLKRSPPSVDVGSIAERFNELADIARTYGVIIALENVHYCRFKTPEIIREVLKNCPDLAATVDVKHSVFAGYDPIKFIDAVEDRLVTLHVTDVDRDENTFIPGRGKFNFEKLFKEIDKRGLDPTVLIEAYPKDYTYNEELADSYKHLKEIIENL